VISALKLVWRMVMVASTKRIPVMTVYVPVSEAELDWLVAKKYLAEKERENTAAIKQAIESFLSASLKAAAV
jgi:hypothetical protein